MEKQMAMSNSWLATPWRRLATVSLFFLCSQGALAAETLVFSTAPTQTAAETVKLYQPLVDYLIRETGLSIQLKPAKNFVEYSNNIRADRYDLVFDGPHFAGWRVEKKGHHVFAKFPGTLSLAVVVRASSQYAKVDDLVGHEVCAVPSPNFLALVFLDQFTNPAREPRLIGVKNFPKGLECLRTRTAQAALFNINWWKKQDATGMKVIFLSKAYPSRAFTAGPRVDKASRDKLQAALLKAHQAGVDGVLKMFKKPRFVPSNDAEYLGLGPLLKPVWGYYDINEL
jgi:ABC-type phosphate/phosphonate transport system substrate-binding protein